MNFFEKIAELQGKVRALQTDVSAQTACKLPSGCVLVKVLLRYVFGLQVGLDGVTVAPSAYSPFQKKQITVRLKGGIMTLSYKNKGRSERTFFVNGVRREGVLESGLEVCALFLREEECSRANIRVEIVD